MPVVAVLAVGIVGGVLLRLAQVPGGAFLGAAFGAAAYTVLRSPVPIRLPVGMEDAALVVLGVAVGAAVSRTELTRLRGALLPAVAAAVFIIVAGVIATLLLRALGVAPTQDLLATSPGALSSVLAVAIEAAVDACRHVIASEGLPAPADYAGAFAVLGEAGFLPAEQVPALQAMARFRNLLVHGYARVDDRIVVDLLQHRLGDLAAFRRAVAARLS